VARSTHWLCLEELPGPVEDLGTRTIEDGSGTEEAVSASATCKMPIAPVSSRGELARNTSFGAFVVTKENSNPGVSGIGVPFAWFAGEKVVSTVPGDTIVSVSIVRPPVEIIERTEILAKGCRSHRRS
jgi:hypothetical protein